jgi:hypothetical protein
LIDYLILLREFSFESEVWQLLLLLQMLKLGTKFSSIQERLLQQERKERATTLGAARNKQVFSTWNNTSLTFRAALNSS